MARIEGFRRALSEKGVPLRDCPIVASDYTSPGGYQATIGLLERHQPTAIFATNDMMGLGVLRAAASAGVSVPGELSVVGFDDIELCRFFYPALTTVGQSIVKSSASARLETLIERVGKRYEGRAAASRDSAADGRARIDRRAAGARPTPSSPAPPGHCAGYVPAAMHIPN
ncbi:MAG: substrate-binding domain-containing protein [Pararobbsia sp.]